MIKLSPGTVLLVAGVSLLLTLGFQLLDLWIEGTPLRFDALTLMVLPGIFFMVTLMYGVGFPKLLAYLDGTSPVWTPFRLRWIEISFLFLMIMLYADLTALLLEGTSFRLSDLLFNLVMAPVAGVLGVRVDRQNGISPELAEGR